MSLCRALLLLPVLWPQIFAVGFLRSCKAMREFISSYYKRLLRRSTQCLNAVRDTDSGIVRLPIDLEVISESMIVVVTGGPGSIIWMAVALLSIMVINIFRLRYFGSSRSLLPTGPIRSMFYALFVVAVVICNTVLFQTKQIVAALPAHPISTLIMACIAVGVIAMFSCRRLVVGVVIFSAAAGLIYVASALVIICGSSALYSGILMIMHSAWEPRAIVCGYIGACAIGSYILNIKHNDYDPSNTRFSQAARLAICEYLLTTTLCVLSGMAIVVSGAYLHGHHVAEYEAASTIINNVMDGKGIGKLGTIVPILSAAIIMTEIYYAQSNWLRVIDCGKYTRTCLIVRWMPAALALAVMLIFGLNMAQVNIMPFVLTSDKLTGLTIFAPICAFIIGRVRIKQIYAAGCTPSLSLPHN